MAERPEEGADSGGTGIELNHFFFARFRAIGDCAMAAWAISAVRERYPTAQITWAVETLCSPVVDTHHLVNHLYEFRRQFWKQRRGNPQAIWDQWRTYAALRNVHADVAVDLQGHFKTSLAVKLVRAKTKISRRATDSLSASLLPQFVGPSPEHEVDLSFAIVSSVVPDLGKSELPIFPPTDAISRDGKPIATITTGASKLEKRVPIDTWQQVAAELSIRGFHVVALGGPKDERLKDHVENQVGQTTLRESMAWLAASRLHLCADTGTGHLAAGYGVPTVSIFMSTEFPVSRFAPRGPCVEVLEQPRDVASILAATDRLLRSQ